MRLLADENVARPIVVAFRDRGHDVAWVRDEEPGASDEHVLARARAEGRILMTFDKDFGELAFRLGLPAACGILLIRIGASSPTQMAKRIVEIVGGRDDWSGHFSVITEDRVRMTPLTR